MQSSDNQETLLDKMCQQEHSYDVLTHSFHDADYPKIKWVMTEPILPLDFYSLCSDLQTEVCL